MAVILPSAPSTRCRGVLLGLAAGDRNGGPIRMALCLAGSLLECRSFDPTDVLGRYLAWWRGDGRDTGPTAGQVLQRIAAGMPPEAAVESVDRDCGGLTAGCNPAHRAAPLALASFLDDDRLPGCAQRDAALTHRHPLAGDAAAAVAVLCRALIRGKSWPEALAAAATGRLPETGEALAEAGAGPGGRGGYAPELLRAAVHFVSGARGFGEALGESLAYAGPANYCPVLVGVLGGARWGSTAIDPHWLRHPALDGIGHQVEATAEALAQGW